MLGRADPWGASGHNHIDLEPDQLRREVCQPIGSALGVAVFEDEVLPLNVSQGT